MSRGFYWACPGRHRVPCSATLGFLPHANVWRDFAEPVRFLDPQAKFSARNEGSSRAVRADKMAKTGNAPKHACSGGARRANCAGTPSNGLFRCCNQCGQKERTLVDTPLLWTAWKRLRINRLDTKPIVGNSLGTALALTGSIAKHRQFGRALKDEGDTHDSASHTHDGLRTRRPST